MSALGEPKTTFDELQEDLHLTGRRVTSEPAEAGSLATESTTTSTASTGGTAGNLGLDLRPRQETRIPGVHGTLHTEAHQKLHNRMTPEDVPPPEPGFPKYKPGPALDQALETARQHGATGIPSAARQGAENAADLAKRGVSKVEQGAQGTFDAIQRGAGRAKEGLQGALERTEEGTERVEERMQGSLESAKERASDLEQRAQRSLQKGTDNVQESLSSSKASSQELSERASGTVDKAWEGSTIGQSIRNVAKDTARDLKETQAQLGAKIKQAAETAYDKVVGAESKLNAEMRKSADELREASRSS